MRAPLRAPVLSVLALKLCLCGPTIAFAQSPPLELAVHPYLPAAEILTRFAPLAAEIERVTGRRLVIRVGQTYRDEIEEIGTNRADIAYLGPGEYLELVNRYGRKPLLARQIVNNDAFLHGEIVVRTDSPFKSLADLKGARLAFTDPISTMSILPLAMLRRSGVAESALGSVHYLEGQRNVALAVLADDADAGAIKEELFKEYEKYGLRSLAATPPVYNFMFVASSTLPRPLVDALQRLLLGLRGSTNGRMIMGSIEPGMTALVAAKDVDYDPVRRIAAGMP